MGRWHVPGDSASPANDTHPNPLSLQQPRSTGEGGVGERQLIYGLAAMAPLGEVGTATDPQR